MKTLKTDTSNKKKELRWMSIYMVLGIITFLISSLDNPAYLISGYSNSEIIIGVVAFIVFGAIYGLLIYYLPSYLIFHKVIKKRRDNADKLEVINNTISIVNEYFRNKDFEIISTNFNVTKEIVLPNGAEFLIDTDSKKFLFYQQNCKVYYRVIDEILSDNSLTLNDLKRLSIDNIPVSLKNFYENYTPKLYNFSDLNKVEVIDKTTTDKKRTYTMQSKSGDALLGAVAGSLVSQTVFNEYATAGAIVGASGERKITENVEKKTNIEFCVNIYLNDIEDNHKSITFYKESELRGFVGVLEYIRNNKDL